MGQPFWRGSLLSRQRFPPQDNEDDDDDEMLCYHTSDNAPRHEAKPAPK